MKRLLCLIAICSLCSAAHAADTAVKLDQVLQYAMAKPAGEDLDLEIAQARMGRLEAMNRRRLELNPQIGMLALTNPVLFAANMGASLLWHRNEVSPLTILDAKIDLAAAEVAMRHRRFQREFEVTHRFFDLAESQQLAMRACGAVSEAETRSDDINRQLSLARLTRADVIRHQQEIVARQADCLQGGQRMRIAASRLSVWVDGPVDSIRAAEEPAGALSLDYPLQPVDFLVQVALTQRSEPAKMHDGIAALRRQVEGAKTPRPLQFNLRYAHLGQQAGLGNSDYLLGGQIVQPEISGRIVLKDNGELSAGKTLLLAKIRKLEHEMEEIEQEIRAQIGEIQIRFEATRGEFILARKRLTLAAEQRRIVAARYRAGLEAPSYLAAAEDAERQAGIELARVEYTGKSSLAAMLSLCGLRDQPLPRQELLVARQHSVSAPARPWSQGSLE